MRDLYFDPPGRVSADQLAALAPADEVAEGLEPVARGVRRHGIDQRDDEILWQGCQTFIAMLLPEALEDSSPLGWRAAGEAAEGLRAVVVGDSGRDAARLAALVLADGSAVALSAAW